jgi:hypothetical protein
VDVALSTLVRLCIGQNLQDLLGGDALASAFTLAHSMSTPGGMLITRYVRNGDVRTGTFE